MVGETAGDSGGAPQAFLSGRGIDALDYEPEGVLQIGGVAVTDAGLVEVQAERMLVVLRELEERARAQSDDFLKRQELFAEAYRDGNFQVDQWSELVAAALRLRHVPIPVRGRVASATRGAITSSVSLSVE